jgi:hypothetical protein
MVVKMNTHMMTIVTGHLALLIYGIQIPANGLIVVKMNTPMMTMVTAKPK